MALAGSIKHLFILNPRSFRRSREVGQVIASIESCFESLGHIEYALYVSRYPLVNKRLGRGRQLVRSYMPYGKVLAVDDVMTNLDVMKGLLLPYGLTLDCVNSGKKAIEKIRDLKE